MERYKPDAVVVGVSPSGLSGDRFGVFNLTLDGAYGCSPVPPLALRSPSPR